MAAWRVGRHMDIEELTRGVHITWVHAPGSALRRAISIETAFGRSKLRAVISLDEGSPALRYDVECDWQETGRQGRSIPQLNFHVPLPGDCQAYRYDIPFGVLERKPCDLDQPANSFIFGAPDGGAGGLMLWSGSTYGFRGVDNSLAVTLIRSSYDPDPYPEQGIHKFTLCIAFQKTGSNKALLNTAYRLGHEISALSDRPHKGMLAMTGGFFELLEGTAAVSAVKLQENEGQALIVRLFETDGMDGVVRLKLFQPPARAVFTDILELEVPISNQIIEVEGCVISFAIKPFALVTLKIEM
jgi:alpha-mannosidase